MVKLLQTLGVRRYTLLGSMYDWCRIPGRCWSPAAHPGESRCGSENNRDHFQRL